MSSRPVVWMAVWLLLGAALPALEKGPLTTMHLMRWSAAMENWHKIHYDLPFTLEHEKLPGLLIAGSLKQQFVVQLLKDWVSQCFEPLTEIHT